ncbi:MAG: hypothetical protein OER98_03605 [Gammaproteobacteria bacterium]|nr:hypothetical protein [Gammaproteobacteria bacterium]
MKNTATSIILLISLLGIVSCATTSAQDEDFAIYGEEPEGPGVFSGESGEIVLSPGETTEQNAKEGAATSSSISASEAEEFNAFKRWLKSKQAQDESYQEFQHWLKYEEYRRLQDPL